MKKTIVEFPRNKIIRNLNQRLTQEEIEYHNEQAKKMEFEELINEMLNVFFTKCFEFKLSFNDPQKLPGRMKQVAMLVESYRGLLYDMKGYSHPFQKVSKDIFVENEHSIELVENANVCIQGTDK